MNNRFLNLLVLTCLTVFWSACSDDDSPQPITINITNQEAGISSASTSAEVTIAFSRAAANEGEIQLTITSGNLTYGTEADFYTDPEASNNVLTLPYVTGDESIGFTVFSGSALNIQEDKSISISLDDSSGSFVLGENTTVTVNFTENFIAPSGVVQLSAGGAEFPNQAFVDLSKLTQTSVDKYSWDLGFYTQEGEHRVILNSSAFTMAQALDKTDLSEVTAQDTVGFGYEMQIPPPGYNPEIGAIEWVDSPDGDLSNTAFGTISTTDTDNKVFIIKRDGDRNWKKVRVLANGDNYTVEYADIASESFETADLIKDNLYNFIFFNLDGGEGSVEPDKTSWDIMYSTYTESFNLGGPGMDIPYGYNDFITINRHSTRVGIVMIETTTYEEFSAGNIADVEFAAEVDAIGENWRAGGGPTTEPSLYEDRFFVLEDSEGTVFKILFTSLTTESERGYPEFKFERVQ